MTPATILGVVKNIARGAAALLVVAAAVKFLVTFSFKAALAIGVGMFALLCLARGGLAEQRMAPAAATAASGEAKPEGGRFAGLKRMLRFKDHEDG
jgi:hypothetical protein